MIAAIVLAAGGSTRLGRPKQLLSQGGRPLVRRPVEAAIEAGCAPVVVVLGAHAGEVRKALAGLAVQLVLNSRWSEGMATSIRCGVEVVRRGAEIDAALLLTCDQLEITGELLGRMLAEFDGRPGRRVACEYAGTVGIPALFHRSLFAELMLLEGDRGARPLLELEPELLRRVSWPEGALDVDRPQDVLD